MAPQLTINPFVPGWGQVPPHLAGREAEQRNLQRLLAYLRVGRGAPRGVILCGPRGNGKTALMRWFMGEVEASAEGLDPVWLTPSVARNLDDLATALVPPRRFRSLRPDKLSFSIGIGRLGWELGGSPSLLTQLLIERCRQRPLVLLLDEAHALTKEVGQALLNASQMVSAEAPFLLVMAGTPDLHRHLNTMSATFWSRGEKIGIGLLDAPAAAEALTRPLAEQALPITFDGAALAQVVAESQCYPYFLQLLGAALWEVAHASGADGIDAALAAQAGPRFGIERSAYYEDRSDELKRRGLLGIAAHLARTFRNRVHFREHELDAAIAAAPRPEGAFLDVDERRDSLADLGYVWKAPGDEDRWRPGIPSLMTYVLDHAER
ncbi:MAG: AAA family ATPase [Gammaproteobacteria bacterium]|nr:AAA family ATPase [Gammaproteobacteria bacterium]